jgi:hypothetical protein
MYAELSDFFYVWLKRTAGHVVPELFTRQLTDKENEAVANTARFPDQKGAKALAERDYQERMQRIFEECRRVLKQDGIMTLMFTHKATGAWDALTKGLMEAGFVISASWPINTEATGSLSIKDKSAANSTILLVCRPRGVLLTATPMQVHPVEVFDLLNLLGLPSEWNQQAFLHFFDDVLQDNPSHEAFDYLAQMFRAVEHAYGEVSVAEMQRFGVSSSLRARRILNALMGNFYPLMRARG